MPRSANASPGAKTGTQNHDEVVQRIRDSVATNCARFADDPVGSSVAMDLILTLRRTATSFQTMSESYTRRYELSPTKVSAIMTLAAAPRHSLSQAQIGRELLVSPGNLTALLVSLEERGLIERRPDPEDGRVTKVSLAAKGVAFVKRFGPFHYGAVAESVSGMSRSEQRSLIVLLDKMRAQLAPGDPAIAAPRKALLSTSKARNKHV